MLWSMTVCHFFHPSEIKGDYMEVGEKQRRRIIRSLQGGGHASQGFFGNSRCATLNAQRPLQAKGNPD